MTEILEMPTLKHPKCNCTDHSDQELDYLTLALSTEMIQIMKDTCAAHSLCGRSAIVVLVTAAHSIMHREGWSDEQVDEEFDMAVELYQHHRPIARQIFEATRQMPPPANQN